MIRSLRNFVAYATKFCRLPGAGSWEERAGFAPGCAPVGVLARSIVGIVSRVRRRWWRRRAPDYVSRSRCLRLLLHLCALLRRPRNWRWHLRCILGETYGPDAR